MTDENPHQFSTQTTGGAFAQITDNTDFPHTGLIKALSLMAKGNMAVKGSATDFDITQATTGNVIQVAAGRIFKDNKLTDQVVAKNFTSSSFNTSSSGSHYHLLVVQSSDNTLQIRKQSDATVADKVPEYDEGDTIIAVIVFNSSTAALGSMQIQFLTTGKTENSLSVGRDDSGYTESLSITSSAGDVVIEAKEQDKDIVLKVNDGGASTEVLRINGSTGNVGIRLNQNATADERLDVEDGNISLTTTSRTTERLIKLRNIGSTTSLSEIAMAGANSNNYEGYIAFKTKGPLDLFNQPLNEVMRIDGNGKVGIGETAPSADLHIKSSSNFDPTSAINTATLILEQTGGTQADDNESVGMTFTKINSGRPFGSIAGVQTGSDADVGGLAFFTHDASTSTDIISEKMRIDGNGNVGIGTASPSNKLEIAGNTVSTNVTATSALAGDTATITTALTNNGLAFNKGEAFSATLGGGVPTVPSFTTSIIYIHDATGNAFTLPPPNTVANSVFTIRNLGTATTAITVTGGGKIDFVPSISGTSLTTHRLVSTPDQIDLPVGDTVVVHAVSDGNPAPLQDSYYIISP